MNDRTTARADKKKTALLAATAGKLSVTPGQYHPFPAAQDRLPWTTLSPYLSDALVARISDLEKPYWPQLPASLYRDFSHTGNRVRFEEPYFARRRNLSSLILAECVQHDGTFMEDIIDGIYAVCEETAWQLPAHNSYVRDTPQLPFPDPSRPILDLFSCETGAVLALCCYLLADELDAENPAVGSYVRNRIAERIITPYLENHFWWMGSEAREPLNNWTPWCTQNVLIASCLLSSFPGFIEKEKLQKIIDQALTSLDCFVDGYGQDGCCSEGAQYYRHAAVCMFASLDIISQTTGVDGDIFWSLPKLRNMALYIRNVHAAGPWYINFADCSALPGPCGAREFVVGEKIRDEGLTRLAAHDRAELPPAPSWEENNIFNRLQDVFAYEKMLDLASRFPRTADPMPDIYYPSNGLFIARDDLFCIGAKAGDNADSHNHNDVGSVTVYAGGKPLLIDLGVETYTQKTFSPRRYEIWTMQSAWHNLPTFGSRMQHDGAGYKACGVSVELEDTYASMTMEIAGAYPPEAGVQSYRRTIRLDKGKELMMTDVHSGSIPPTLSLLFAEEPVISGTSIIAAGHTLHLEGESCSLRCEKASITDARLAPAWGTAVWRILVDFTNELIIRIPHERSFP